MTSKQRKTSDEGGADQVEGLLTRREAMRRLALVGVTATFGALSAACSGRGGLPRRRRRRRH